MNIFQSDKAPYVLGLLVTVFSWHVSQIGNEITKTQAVTYRLDVDRQTGEVIALVRNVSRTKSLVKATFSLACSGGHDCLAPLQRPAEGARPVYGEVRPIVPNAVAPEPVPPGGDESNAVTRTNTVAAGGQYQIAARLAPPHRRTRPPNWFIGWLPRSDAPIEFFFIPDENRALDILIYDSRSVTGFLIENYFRFLIVLFFLFFGLLIFSTWANLQTKDKGDSTEGGADGN